MTTLAALVAESIAVRGDDFEVAVFGTSITRSRSQRSSSATAPITWRRCNDALFYRVSVGAVAAFTLADGRRVVVKVQPLERRHRPARRGAASAAPPPHRGAPGTGAARRTHERSVPGWRRPRSTSPAGPRAASTPRSGTALACLLHRIVTVASTLVGVEDVGGSTPVVDPDAPLWGEPHDLKFDFVASAAGASRPWAG